MEGRGSFRGPLGSFRNQPDMALKSEVAELRQDVADLRRQLVDVLDLVRGLQGVTSATMARPLTISNDTTSGDGDTNECKRDSC